MSKVTLIFTLSLVTMLTITPTGTWAETVTIPIGHQGSQTPKLKLPQRGQSQTTVIHEFGEPLTKSAAVGVPPISRWDYEHFSVFFEYQNVLHSVIKHIPASKRDATE